jgi:hypothetical protein
VTGEEASKLRSKQIERFRRSPRQNLSISYFEFKLIFYQLFTVYIFAGNDVFQTGIKLRRVESSPLDSAPLPPAPALLRLKSAVVVMAQQR